MDNIEIATKILTTGDETPRQVLRRMLTELAMEDMLATPLEDTKETHQTFQDLIGHREDERFAAIFVDQGRRQIGEPKVFEGGSRTRTTLYPRVLFKEALTRDATGIILAHNHPGGTCLPSQQDRELTRRVAELGGSMEVSLLDHILVTKTKAISFRHKGWL